MEGLEVDVARPCQSACIQVGIGSGWHWVVDDLANDFSGAPAKPNPPFLSWARHREHTPTQLSGESGGDANNSVVGVGRMSNPAACGAAGCPC